MALKKLSVVSTVSSDEVRMDMSADHQARKQQEEVQQPNVIVEYIKKRKFAFTMCLFQIAFFVLFVIFSDYDSVAQANQDNKPLPAIDAISHTYPLFQDVHVMIFVGFGFLMTFLKRYGYSSVGLNFLIACFVLEWATLMIGFFHDIPEYGKIHINIVTLLSADFVAAAVLISFGAVLGKLSPLQLIIMTFIEVAVFQVNEYIGREHLHAIDAGDSIFVHAFGAYFGLAVARVTFTDEILSSDKEGASKQSDLFSMIGTVFLWIYWPSFNAGALAGDARHRAIINTYYAIAASCIAAFFVSSMCHRRGKFEMVHIQNSTLAGGVAVGASADMMLYPWGSMLIGMLAGAVSVVGFKFLTPALTKKLHTHDTCGVNNLHGMPALMAGIISAIGAAAATKEQYGMNLFTMFPMRAPENVTGTDLEGYIDPGMGWTAGQQAGHQLAALAVTLVMAIVGGAITGLIVKDRQKKDSALAQLVKRSGFLVKVGLFDSGPEAFEDNQYWEVPDAESLEAIKANPSLVFTKTPSDALMSSRM